MIRRIFANQAGFHEVKLKPGFNVVVAERTQESTKKDTRNGVGKSTLLEVVHFCLGSDGKAFNAELLEAWQFGLDLVLAGRELTVLRSVANPKRVLLDGDLSELPVTPKLDSSSGMLSLDTKEWVGLLGAAMFGLPAVAKKGAYTPTFRSLISYFARRGRDAFSQPFEHFRKQQEWDKQVNIAFLLGLDWEDAQSTQLLRDKQAALTGLRKAVKGGLVAGLGGKRSDLDNLLIRLEEQARAEAERLASFRVHAEYSHIQDRAGAITDAIHTLVNSNYQHRQMLALYQRDLSQEAPPDDGEVERLFAEAGVALGDSVRKRLDDVQNFHRTVVSNRREFLATEAAHLSQIILENENRVASLTEERAVLLSVLQTHGALEEHTKLEQLHLQTVGQVNETKTLLENMNKLDKGGSELKIEKELLLQRGRRDYDERHAIRAKAVNLFNANSTKLYDAPGRLLVDFTAHSGHRDQTNRVIVIAQSGAS